MKQIPTVRALVLQAMQKANSVLVRTLLFRFLHVYKLTISEPVYLRHGDSNLYELQNIHELTHCPMMMVDAGHGVKYKVVLSTYKGRMQVAGPIKHTFNIEVAKLDYNRLEKDNQVDYVSLQKFLWKSFERQFYPLIEYNIPNPIASDMLHILQQRGYVCDMRVCRPTLFGFSNNRYWTPEPYDCPVFEYGMPIRITAFKDILNSSQWRY